MRIIFPFKKEPSSLFRLIHRPMAWVYFWIKKEKTWLPIYGIVDTGADYTILPSQYALQLGISLKKDCLRLKTKGVGGYQKVYFLKEKTTIRVGNFQKQIPLGFFERGQLPPLFGRQAFLEDFKLTFYQHKTTFEN